MVWAWLTSAVPGGRGECAVPWPGHSAEPLADMTGSGQAYGPRELDGTNPGMCVEGEALPSVGVPEECRNCCHHKRMVPARQKQSRGRESESQVLTIVSNP